LEEKAIETTNKTEDINGMKQVSIACQGLLSDFTQRNQQANDIFSGKDP
jgi:hypothetical protein